MKYVVLLLISCLLVFPAMAQLGNIRGVAQEVRAQGEEQSVKLYDAMLREHVDADGWVDYAAIVEKPHRLDTFVRSLAKIDLKAMEDDEHLATLINAYNAFTLQLIVQNYDDGELESIRDLHDGKPWNEKMWRLGGEVVSLNQIEHEMIRPVFDEPRIHWALVCAAYSCPPLRNEAYSAAKLEEQLRSQETYVHHHERFLQVKPDGLYVTKLYEWYGSDFGDPLKYVLQQRRMNNPPDKLRFLPYDWSLNSVENKP